MLRITEAANRLGVTATTLRRWEAEGLITPDRTAGGERRYQEAELDELAGRLGRKRTQLRENRKARGREGERLERPGAGLEDTSPDMGARLPPSAFAQQSTDSRVLAARAELQVRRLELEKAEVDRNEREAEVARERRRREAARAADDQEARRRAGEQERVRLASLRQYGEMLALAAGAPAEYRAEVTRDLMTYVTPAQFPLSASWQANEIIKARVERTLKSWREQERRIQEVAERARASERERQHCDELVAFGLSHAEAITVFWDSEDREDVREDVEETLRDEVCGDWTRDDVIEIVDEILAEWD